MTPKTQLQQLIEAHKERLHLLRLREAWEGRAVDPAVLIEIEAIEQKIAALEEQLEQIDPPPITRSISAYHLILILYPGDFQKEFGPEMAEVFRQQCLAA